MTDQIRGISEEPAEKKVVVLEDAPERESAEAAEPGESAESTKSAEPAESTETAEVAEDDETAETAETDESAKARWSAPAWLRLAAVIVAAGLLLFGVDALMGSDVDSPAYEYGQPAEPASGEESEVG